MVTQLIPLYFMQHLLHGPTTVKNTATGTYTAVSSGSGDIITQTIPSNTVTLHRPLYDFSQASIDLVESVALEQTALSHIINAEGEKIQAMLAIPRVTTAQLLEVNKSVQNMIDTITLLENILGQKLKIVENQMVSC
ncbi:MAG: hypothetical protein RSF67_02200 [Clostridia bacterium]